MEGIATLAAVGAGTAIDVKQPVRAKGDMAHTVSVGNVPCGILGAKPWSQFRGMTIHGLALRQVAHQTFLLIEVRPPD